MIAMFSEGDHVRIPCGYDIDIKAFHLGTNAPAVTKLRRHLGHVDAPLDGKHFCIIDGTCITMPAWTPTVEAAVDHVNSPLVCVYLGDGRRRMFLLGWTDRTDDPVRPTAQEVQLETPKNDAMACKRTRSVYPITARLVGAPVPIPRDLKASKSILMLPACLDTDVTAIVHKVQGDFCKVDMILPRHAESVDGASSFRLTIRHTFLSLVVQG